MSWNPWVAIVPGQHWTDGRGTEIEITDDITYDYRWVVRDRNGDASVMTALEIRDDFDPMG